MPLVPLIVNPYQNAEELGLGQGSAELIDGHIDEVRCLFPRGGLIKWVNFPDTRCNGVYWWRERSIFVAVFGDNLYKVNADLSVTAVNDATTRLSTGRATFASNEYWLYVANGGQILCWDGANAPSYAVAPAPNPCATVAYIDGYILGNKAGTRSWYYADPDPSDASKIHVWAATGLSKDGGPDLLQGVFAKWREVFVIGDRTCEVWYDSGSSTSPFERVEGAFIEMGTPSAPTVVNADNTWLWLNQFRQVIRLKGRTPEIISGPIEKHLRALSRVDDAVATLMDGRYIISFPTDNVTWVYNFALGYWSRWGKWEAERGLWDRWLGETAVEVDAYGVNVVAGRSGHLYLYHPLITMDAGDPIRCRYRGPHINHGTYHRKVSRIILNVKQGITREYLVDSGESLAYFLCDRIEMPDGDRCTYYAFDIPTVGGQLAESVSGLPTGLTFDSSQQRVSGTPQENGDFEILINYRTPSGLLVPSRVNLHLNEAYPTILLPGE